ncbi:mannose-1-phosphate guanylyltransferase/mannose-6-phosphate isomerase [Variovorax sp. PCZ-1]|uniref:mannose-1-phosphate guanylyltransferase/mannose-6-phosphate isomerase n=1 Tax=Variovorax sp. PCZ-1 TaxID=2835533 RepID=UPI001BCC735B|nr:mannose-1-phosphate guanylyltransferase/mannose-6-phosphate isomerase [Variovorax sp. PCZ-1]MBS7807668.1 mannose-1-phosphate guanylyltransferase/mannose-6-phosphate isomerase [Variovorax sp. PCZ-1]
MKTIAIILCGGSGSRLWPLSRQSEPKQFHAFDDSQSLLAETVKRADALACIDEILIVSSALHQHLLPSHVEPYSDKPIHYLLEPVARNTAGAITAATHYAKHHMAADDKSCLIVMPSDHHITDAGAFQLSIEHALVGALTGRLLTFGVTPSSPETGYGYIQKGAPLVGTACNEVVRFVEKPDLVKAIEMLSNSDFAWNSGIFVFQVEVLLEETHQFEPQIYEQCLTAVLNGKKQKKFFILDLKAIEACPSKSIDYAVFERSKKIAVATMAASWSDLGSWGAVSDLTLGQQVNASKSPVINIDSQNNYVHANKTVAIVGISDIVVVDTPDALLITHKDQSQSVKKVVDLLNQKQPHLVETHAKVRRPWGTYESMHQSAAHQVKYIVVEPGERLSLQSHEHRAEHWVVVAGQATITVGETCATYSTGQHVYIEKQEKHRLENHTQEPVAIIEVQIGSYLGEDDIKRFDDVYGRS